MIPFTALSLLIPDKVKALPWKLIGIGVLILFSFIAGWKTKAYIVEHKALKEAVKTQKDIIDTQASDAKAQDKVVEKGKKEREIIYSAPSSCDAPLDPCVVDALERLRNGSKK